VPVRLAQREPRDVDRLVVRVVLDRQLTADRLEEVVVDVLVDPSVRGREPVVDGPELDEHPAEDAGLLGDLAHGRLRERLLALDVTLRETPLDPAGAVAARDDGDERLTVDHVDDHATGGALLARGQPLGVPSGLGGGVGHKRHCNQSACWS
jgi:hypothetical protein